MTTFGSLTLNEERISEVKYGATVNIPKFTLVHNYNRYKVQTTVILKMSNDKGFQNQTI